MPTQPEKTSPRKPDAHRRLIQKEIQTAGPMPFARFMARALYHPTHGYYARPGRTIGRGGDFYTSPSVGSLFGELLAWQIARWSERTSPRPLQVVEAGAHDGRLARDLLEAFCGQHPALFARLGYWLLEPSPRWQACQQQTLLGWQAKTQWFKRWSSLPPAGVTGVILANELLDALPVHRLGWDAARREWFEWGVTIEGDGFGWVRLPWRPAPQAQRAWQELEPPPDLAAVLPDGYTVEFCPAARQWWRQAARALRAGRLMTADYGLTAEEKWRPHRPEGTLRGYSGHRLITDVLQQPGEIDLTAHVDFEALKDAGESEGLKTEMLCRQEGFLVNILKQIESAPGTFPAWTPARLRQFQTLAHPAHLGRAFRVLVQTRTVEP